MLLLKRIPMYRLQSVPLTPTRRIAATLEREQMPCPALPHINHVITRIAAEVWRFLRDIPRRIVVHVSFFHSRLTNFDQHALCQCQPSFFRLCFVARTGFPQYPQQWWPRLRFSAIRRAAVKTGIFTAGSFVRASGPAAASEQIAAFP